MVVSTVSFAIISVAFLYKNLNLVWPSLNEVRQAIFSIKLNSVVIVLQQLITPLSIALLTIIAAQHKLLTCCGPLLLSFAWSRYFYCYL